MKIYISGPMTGFDNQKAFRTAARHLRKTGWKVVDPSRFSKKGSYAEYMRANIYKLINKQVSAVFFLRGWKKSKGAQLEYQIALILDLQIFDEEALERKARREHLKRIKIYPAAYQPDLFPN